MLEHKTIDIKNLLLKKVMGEDMSAEEQSRLDAWRKESEANDQLAQRAATSHFFEEAVQDNVREEAVESWEQLSEKMHADERKQPFVRHLYHYVAAASVLLCLVFGAMQMLKDDAPTAEPTPLFCSTQRAMMYLDDGSCMEMTSPESYEEYMKKVSLTGDDGAKTIYHIMNIPRGSEYAMTLPDRSNIHLNAGSSLTIPADFTAKHRTVHFDGEGYFDISHAPHHPFVVQTALAEVKVLGTKFCIRKYADDDVMCVTLEEGRVEINSAYEIVTITPGEQAIVHANGHIEKRQVDTYTACAWHQQRIVYDNETLLHILDDLGRVYDFQASFSTDRLRNLHVSMDIDKTADFASVASLIEKMSKIKIKIHNKNVIVQE